MKWIDVNGKIIDDRKVIDFVELSWGEVLRDLGKRKKRGDKKWK